MDEKAACKKILEKMSLTGAQVICLDFLCIFLPFPFMLIGLLLFTDKNRFAIQTGKTKVFLRAGQMADLDARRALILSNAAKTIQRKIRTHIARKHFLALQKAAVYMQSACRGL